ncbi:MAG TPA: hypothetical protein VJ276_03400 [Thermoanaerobaculia bacterium]|nr:hypothetical protein [Thermoanaerobaculia bacterium]
MRSGLLALVLVALAFPLLAADYEQFMLPVAPSVTMCAFNSRYEARLLVFNDQNRAIQSFCADGDCGALAAKSGVQMTGPDAGPTPRPRFLYVPKEDAAHLRMSLLVESMDLDKPEERSYAELPVIRASDFRHDKVQLFVRVDPGFRQGLRIYSLDGHQATRVIMRVFTLESNELMREETYWVWPEGAWENEAGLQAGPAFSMECDLSVYPWLVGRQVRVELEPVEPETKIWGFISVTNNKTQHFYVVTPR